MVRVPQVEKLWYIPNDQNKLSNLIVRLSDYIPIYYMYGNLKQILPPATFYTLHTASRTRQKNIQLTIKVFRNT